MSYILDALKKSDQERKHGEVPGLDSFQGQPKPPMATSRILLYVLIGALLINGVAIGLWMTLRQDPAAIETAEVSDAANQPVTTSREEQTTADSPGLTAVKSKDTEPVETEVAELPVEAESESDSVAFTESDDSPPEEVEEESKTDPTRTTFEKLPADVRNDLPELKIAAHYYAGKPSSRMASINGRIMRQGQTISDDLVLEEITREGVIFRFHNYLFSMDVFIR